MLRKPIHHSGLSHARSHGMFRRFVCSLETLVVWRLMSMTSALRFTPVVGVPVCSVCLCALWSVSPGIKRGVTVRRRRRRPVNSPILQFHLVLRPPVPSHMIGPLSPGVTVWTLKMAIVLHHVGPWMVTAVHHHTFTIKCRISPEIPPLLVDIWVADMVAYHSGGAFLFFLLRSAFFLLLSARHAVINQDGQESQSNSTWSTEKDSSDSWYLKVLQLLFLTNHYCHFFIT